MNNIIKPVKGAARYFASLDDLKPSVWMEIPPDEHCDENMYYVVQRCKTIETAVKAAEKWQIKENKSVLKNFPELNQ